MTRIWFWTFAIFLAAVLIRAIFAFLGDSISTFALDFVFNFVVAALIIKVQMIINKWADDLDARGINSTYREENFKKEVDRIVKELDTIKVNLFNAGGSPASMEAFCSLNRISVKFETTREWLEKDHVRTARVMVPVPAMIEAQPVALAEPSDASETVELENGSGFTRKPITEILKEVYDNPRQRIRRRKLPDPPPPNPVPAMIPDETFVHSGNGDTDPEPSNFEIKTNNILW